MLFPRADFDDVLGSLLRGELLPGDIRGHVRRPSEPARWADFEDAVGSGPDGVRLNPKLVAALQAVGVTAPYTHQA